MNFLISEIPLILEDPDNYTYLVLLVHDSLYIANHAQSFFVTVSPQAHPGNGHIGIGAFFDIFKIISSG